MLSPESERRKVGRFKNRDVEIEIVVKGGSAVQGLTHEPCHQGSQWILHILSQ
jgi:hypothetical protein